MANGHLYIGSAFVLFNRYRCHKSMLGNCCHDNKHLQRAYNKYGGENFIFEAIEIHDETDVLRTREQFHLDKYFDGGVSCYNMTPSVDPVWLNSKYRKDYILIDPYGNEVVFKESLITEIVRKIHTETGIRISSSGLCHVIKGNNLSHKGWRLPKNKNYDYKNWRKNAKIVYRTKKFNVRLRAPDGSIYGPIVNLEKFSRAHGMRPSALHNLIAGRTRYILGWSIFNGSLEKPAAKNSKTVDIKLKSPEGVIYGPINNFAQFCRDNSLNISSMRGMVFRNKGKKMYRGWCLLETRKEKAML